MGVLDKPIWWKVLSKGSLVKAKLVGWMKTGLKAKIQLSQKKNNDRRVVNQIVKRYLLLSILHPPPMLSLPTNHTSQIKRRRQKVETKLPSSC